MPRKKAFAMAARTGRISSDFCYVLGFNGAVAFPGDRFEPLDDFLDKNPFLSRIPSGRLYESINPAKPFMLEDPIRRAVWSGALAPYIANKKKMSLSHIFTKENVGIHKDLGLLVFKDVPRKREVISGSSENYHHYSTFLKETIKRHHGDESLNALPIEMDIYLQDLTNPAVNEESIVDHAMTIPGRVFGDLSVEIYRLLCKEYPLVGKQASADKIICAVGAKYNDPFRIALGSGLLPQFLPLKWRKKYPPNHYPWSPFPNVIVVEKDAGKIIIEIHRHGSVHSLELDVDAVVTANFPLFSGSKFTRMEVIELIRHLFPEYLSTVLEKFKSEGLFEDLKIRERHPIPSLYSVKCDGIHWIFRRKTA